MKPFSALCYLSLLLITTPSLGIAAGSAKSSAVYFDYNSSTLSSTAMAALDQLRKDAAHTPTLKRVVVHGTSDQADPSGTNETADYYNSQLAYARANAVKLYLSKDFPVPVRQGDIHLFDKAAYDTACDKLASKAARNDCKLKGRRVDIEWVNE